MEKIEQLRSVVNQHATKGGGAGDGGDDDEVDDLTGYEKLWQKPHLFTPSNCSAVIYLVQIRHLLV